MAFTKKDLALRNGHYPCYVGGAGDPVLCLHGAYGVRLSPAMERLAESFRLWLPVMPGFDGTSALPGLQTMPELADFVADIIDAEIKAPCDVFGHSFGGWLAAWLAVRHPDKIRYLILDAPAGFRPEGAGGLPADAETLRRRIFAHPEHLPPEAKSPEILEQNRRMLHHYHADMATDRDLVALLKDIKAQTLILHGTRDGVIPLESPRLLRKQIPHANLVYVYDAAHSIDTDQPERFAQLVHDFLTRGEAFIVNWQSRAAINQQAGQGEA